MPTVTLASDDVGSLFAIPEADWTAINKRVGIVWLARDIAPQIEQYLPDFLALEAVSQQWKDTTFPGLVTQSGAISTYSGEAITSFTSLQQAIAGLDPNSTLPPNILSQAQSAIGTLASNTSSVASQAALLGTAVASFTNENQIVDSKINQYVSTLGPDWTAISAETNAVDQAVGLVRGTWSAIVDDLNAVTSGKIAITTQLLLSLDIASALLSWQNVQAEAEAFASMASGQEPYLSGQWASG